MTKLNIICVDDQREVLAALRKDLAYFKDICSINDCESADEAMELLEEIDADGESVALIICDHVMPGKNGVDFLIDVNKDARFANSKKLLLTGMATHQDTIVAINQANIDRYIEKPWDIDHLIETAKTLLTTYIIDAGIDHQPYLKSLDQETLFRDLHKRGYLLRVNPRGRPRHPARSEVAQTRN
jgi:two-component system chemotaxis response regulator CheY